MSMKLIAGLLLSFVSASTFARWGTSITTITGYYVWDNGYAYIKVASNENPDNCAVSKYLRLDTNASNFKAIWSTVIAAYATKSTVSVSYNGCAGDYISINSVAVPYAW